MLIVDIVVKKLILGRVQILTELKQNNKTKKKKNKTKTKITANKQYK